MKRREKQRATDRNHRHRSLTNENRSRRLRSSTKRGKGGYFIAINAVRDKTGDIYLPDRRYGATDQTVTRLSGGNGVVRVHRKSPWKSSPSIAAGIRISLFVYTDEAWFKLD
ncbi:hypothetical protein Bca4012_008877 [Brassica carinata]